MFDTEKKEFKVGDVIITKNWCTTYKRTVTRVTKLHAVCDIVREDGTGYTTKFKKEYQVYKDGKAHLTPVPRIDWDQNEYTVISKEQ